MTSFKLKSGQEDFDVVDGEFAGKRYRKGKTYTVIPSAESHRFDRVEKTEHPVIEAAADTDRKPEKTGLKNGAKGASDPKRFKNIEYDPGGSRAVKTV